MVRSVVNKSVNRDQLIQNIGRRLPLDAIEIAKGMSLNDLLTEMESIVLSGTRLDISYHLNDIMEEDVQEEIMDYFRGADTDSIDAAHKEFDGDCSEEELRMMRIKFLSEVAN